MQRSAQYRAASEVEKSLLARAASGDQQGMTDLFDRYSSLVYSVALRVLNDPGQAEDVMQHEGHAFGGVQHIKHHQQCQTHRIGEHGLLFGVAIRRALRLELTPSGRSIHKRMIACGNAAAERAFAEISQAERRQLVGPGVTLLIPANLTATELDATRSRLAILGWNRAS